MLIKTCVNKLGNYKI